MNAVEDIAKPATRTLGEVFAAERERQGLARLDVAQRLHMSTYQVEALEAGEFARLPQGTFLRGFVRNYAKLLGLAPETVLPMLEETGPTAKKPGIVVPTQNIRFDPLGERLANPYIKAGVLAFVVIAIAFAAMYWWVFIRTTPPVARKNAPPAQEATPAAAAPAPPVPEATRVAIAPPPSPEPVKTREAPVEARKAPVEPPKKAEAPKAPPAPPVEKTTIDAGGGSVLKFRFRGPSWVEIRDGRGKVILSKLNPSGSETEISGKPPFNVIVGNAPEVELFYNDQQFDLEPHTRVAVARFTVE